MSTYILMTPSSKQSDSELGSQDGSEIKSSTLPRSSPHDALTNQ